MAVEILGVDADEALGGRRRWACADAAQVDG
jgi:hypothetical protein